MYMFCKMMKAPGYFFTKQQTRFSVETMFYIPGDFK
jgi:hypothetical protein